MSKSQKEVSGLKKFWRNLTKAHDLESEDEILLDHDYDGIKELDNVLPPWWLYGFFITIVISIVYYFNVFNNPEKYNQEMEYEIEVAEAQAEVEAYKEANPELFDDSNIVATTDPADLARGKALFTEKTCVACHLVDLGGSIGPNLTDNRWILGGDVVSIFNTLTNGGRPGKGMIAWESTISREDRILLASYIISMQGTTPANPKAPEGDIIYPEE